MADKEIKPLQSDEVTGVKTNETQGTCQATNQEEKDHEDTDATANNDDAHTQSERMVENAKKGPDTEGFLEKTKENSPFVDYDGGDCEEENRNKTHCVLICEEPDGPHIKTNEEFGGSPTVSTKETTAAPPVDQDRGDCETTQEENLNKMHSGKKEVDGSHVKSKESEDSLPVSNEGTTAAPAGDDDGTFISNPTPLSQKPPISEMVPDNNVETVGPIIQAESAAIFDVPAAVKDNKRRLWIGVVLVVVVAALFQQLLQPESPPQKKDVLPIDIFRQEMEKVKLQFPSQREELWKRSRIHLQRHFLITQPTEPVSIILTAGVRAEGTLHCLARSIASALSSALNASALHLEGASKSNQDSDVVKSDIDSQLQKAFEGGKPIAVIHRFEELPPASTLIFYRYCDHENAAFKKTFLIFTVLLGEEEEIEAKIPLNEVEEMVTDHLQKKFLAHDHPTAFDKMDIDKYGGLWSRISHLILPVSTERRIEKTGQC